MKFQDIHIRDPFILFHDNRYYLYGSRGAEAWGKCTGLDVYLSDNLEDWSSPTEAFTPPMGFWSDRHFWAPEVHKYHDKFYMFVSFKSETRCRGVQILQAETPAGPFVPHSDGPVTPSDWECLDGTLYIDKEGNPYIVFCHEWLQVTDGEMCAMRLSGDLKTAATEPWVLFRASEPAWALKNAEAYVTDGPFLFRTKEDRLLMIWSSMAAEGYCEAVSYSDNGEITGKWLHEEELLFAKDGGHGMIFSAGDKLEFVFHSPNSAPLERPVLVDIRQQNGRLLVSKA